MENFNSHKHITLSFYLTADQIKQIRALVFNTPVSSPLSHYTSSWSFLLFLLFHLWERNSSKKSFAKAVLGYNNKRCPPILSGKMDDLLFYLAQSTAACMSLSECVGVTYEDRTFSIEASWNKLYAVGFGVYPSSFAVTFSILKSMLLSSIISLSNCKTFQGQCARSSNVFFYEIIMGLTLKLSQEWS